MEEGVSTKTPGSNWPGERDPSRKDVEEANDVPEPAWLSEFKGCLLADSEIQDNEPLMHLDLQVGSARKYTYPLTLLSAFPSQLPSEDEIAYLREISSNCCSNHVFLSPLAKWIQSRELVAAPLSLAASCLASVHVRHDAAQARDLFLASRYLSGVLMEIDNKESRSPDLLLAATLNSMYGASSSDTTIWDRAGQQHCTAVTIMRRMRYHDPNHSETDVRHPAPSYRYDPKSQPDSADLGESGPLVWCLWLIDIVQSLHFDLSINLFSSRELWTSMPSSSREFQDVYRCMLDDRAPRMDQVAVEATQEDMLLLLMGLLADLLYARQSLGQVVQLAASDVGSTDQYNPHVPFSPRRELFHVEDQLSLALDRWYTWFYDSASPEVRALYHYVKMYLSFDQLLSLPQAVGYPGSQPPLPPNKKFSVSDDAIREAWHVLDGAAAWSQQSPTDRLCPIWLPIVTFHAGLVIWAHFCSANAQAGYGSPRVILAFKIELDAMPWPCCLDMAATLARLISAGSSSQGQQYSSMLQSNT